MRYIYKVSFRHSLRSKDKGQSFERYFSSLAKAKRHILSWWTKKLNNFSLKADFTEESEGFWQYDLKDYHSKERVNTYTNRQINRTFPAQIKKCEVDKNIN